MPRELDELPPLTKQAAHLASPEPPQEQGMAGSGSELNAPDLTDKLMRDMQKEEARSRDHVRGATLAEKDVAQCLELETQAFAKPEHRCTEEKFRYRLTKCPELCLGIFVTAEPDSTHMEAPTAAHADNVVTDSDRKNVLVAHVISTLTNNATILDEDMALPPRGGHNPAGRTIALHSLAVLPGYQNKGIGSIALRDYIKRMNTTGAYDRIAIITYEELVPYYERFGFRNLGASRAQFGGGGWIDMVLELDGDSYQS